MDSWVAGSEPLVTSGSITVVGEALIDLVPAGQEGLFEARPGGSPANVAVGLARLEVPVRLAARIADDVFGRRLRAHQADNGVDLAFAVRAREPTSLAIVSLGPHGGPEYDFRIQGTADWQWSDQELHSGQPRAGLAYRFASSHAAARRDGNTSARRPSPAYGDHFLRPELPSVAHGLA